MPGESTFHPIHWLSAFSFFGLSISVFMEGQWASRLRAEGSQGSGEFCIFAMADVTLSQTLKVFAMAFGHFAETI